MSQVDHILNRLFEGLRKLHVMDRDIPRLAADCRALRDACRLEARNAVLKDAGIEPAKYERLMTNAVGLELAGTKFVVYCERAEDAGFLKAFVTLNEGKAFEIGEQP